MGNLKEAQYHAWFHHHDSDGWITVAKKSLGGFQQRYYKPQELAKSLSDWLGGDVYFSQNTFYKPQRQIQNLRQLKSLYVDLDFYLFNYDPSWIIGKLEYDFLVDKVSCLYGDWSQFPTVLCRNGKRYRMSV